MCKSGYWKDLPKKAKTLWRQSSTRDKDLPQKFHFPCRWMSERISYWIGRGDYVDREWWNLPCGYLKNQFTYHY